MDLEPTVLKLPKRKKRAGPRAARSPPYCLSRRSAGAEQLNDGAPSSCGQMDHQKDDPDDEENPRNLRSDRRHAGRSEHTSNQSDDEKHESVIQHGNTSFS